MGTLPQKRIQDPSSYDEAEALYAELNDACVLIQAQLSNTDHINEDGDRLTGQEYLQWRNRATWALSQKRIQMGQVKRWMATRKQEALRIEAGVRDPKNVVELFGALLKIVRGSKGWRDMTAEELAVIALSERWIRTKGAPALVAAREQAEAAS